MQRYDKYKPSGIEWIGEIPEHWEVKKLKYTLSALESGNRQTGGGNQLTQGVFSLGGEHIGWFGELLLNNPKLISEEYYCSMNNGKILENDILLVKDGATIGKIAIVKEKPFEKCAVNEHVFILRANQNYEPSFIFYYLWCDVGRKQILMNIKGSAQPGLNTNFVNEIYLTYFTKSEQTTIANYLDQKTAQIDKLISKKEQLLKLYEEEKTVIINQAVTKGVPTSKGNKGGRSEVKLKDSGIEWLGEIPEHWEVKKIKHFCKIQGRIGFKGYKSSDLVSEGQGALTLGATHISKKNKIDLSNPVYLNWEKYFESPEIMVKKGDIVFTQRGAYLGKVGYINKNYWATQQALDLTKDEIIVIAKNSIYASFLNETDKQQWLNHIDQYVRDFID